MTYSRSESPIMDYLVSFSSKEWLWTDERQCDPSSRRMSTLLLDTPENADQRLR